MKALSHPNILNLIGVSVDAGDSPYVIMPYMANGSLLSYLRKERPNLTIAVGAGVDLVSSISCVYAFYCQVVKCIQRFAGSLQRQNDLQCLPCKECSEYYVPTSKNCIQACNKLLHTLGFKL